MATVRVSSIYAHCGRGSEGEEGGGGEKDADREALESRRGRDYAARTSQLGRESEIPQDVSFLGVELLASKPHRANLTCSKLFSPVGWRSEVDQRQSQPRGTARLTEPLTGTVTTLHLFPFHCAQTPFATTACVYTRVRKGKNAAAVGRVSSLWNSQKGEVVRTWKMKQIVVCSVLFFQPLARRKMRHAHM